MPGPETEQTRVNKLQTVVGGKIPNLVMSKGLVAAANWLLGPLSFKKQVHGMDCNGNGWVESINWKYFYPKEPSLRIQIVQ